MSNLKTKEVLVNIECLEEIKENTVTFMLDHGYVVGAEAYITNATTLSNYPTLSLTDDSGNRFVNDVDVRHWRSRDGGGFLQGLRPLGFNTGGKKYKLRVAKPEGIYDVRLQVIFIIRDFEETKNTKK